MIYIGDIRMNKWNYTEVSDKDRLVVFIGESKKDKYLLKFGIRIYDDHCIYLRRRAKLSWNWSAFFGGILWMGYRKMYVELIVFSTLILLSNLIFSEISENVDAIITALCWIFFGLMSNSFYYYRCKRKITRLKKLNLSLHDELETLMHKGGTSVAGIFISIIALMIHIAIYVVIKL